MIEIRWRNTKEGERGFQLAPDMRGREYVLQYREAPVKITTEYDTETWSYGTDWKDVEINDD